MKVITHCNCQYTIIHVNKTLTKKKKQEDLDFSSLPFKRNSNPFVAFWRFILNTLKDILNYRHPQ